MAGTCVCIDVVGAEFVRMWRSVCEYLCFPTFFILEQLSSVFLHYFRDPWPLSRNHNKIDVNCVRKNISSILLMDIIHQTIDNYMITHNLFVGSLSLWQRTAFTEPRFFTLHALNDIILPFKTSSSAAPLSFIAVLLVDEETGLSFKAQWTRPAH